MLTNLAFSKHNYWRKALIGFNLTLTFVVVP